ncbi:rhamnogalacturonan lyase family protein [Streptomyces zhihengii]
MESLDRGVVAVRADADSVFVSWRLLGLEPEGTGFNVYRSTAGGSWTKLNAATLTKGTNFTDDGADLTRENRYRVKAVVAGSEGAASAAFTLTADHADEPAVRIPLRDGGSIKYAWVGDLDGDGAYDFVIDRTAATQGLEAYTSKGTFLWAVDMGPNSADQDNIEPGSAAISTGHWDGVTVYDFDGDGRAEVAVRVGDGVTFGDGTVHEEADDVRQSIAILDGRTGAPRATAPVPGDYASDGPMGARFGVGHLDGTTPSLVAYMKNRVGSGGFNLMYTAWRFDGDELTRQWKWLRGDRAASDGHNTRIIDVDGDGTDEIAEIGFLLDGDGTLRYSLADQGIGHGDRFHIGDLDPARPGLEGYGVQQDHPGGLREYYYDARTGTVLWKHVESGVTDVGRGLAADIDPRHSGMEVWSFSGIHNARSNRLTEPDTSLAPWPQLAFQWDGDLSSELLNNGRFEQWDPENPKPSGSLPRLLSTWTYGAADASGGYNPLLYGDILGDWREEAVYKNTDDDELIVFTTDIPTDTRLYTPAHNPAYRNAMTLHGYMQSHHTDYYLGSGMATPPRPDIAYVTT